MSAKLPKHSSAMLTGDMQPEEVERLLKLAETDPEACAELDFLADLCAAVERERNHLEAAIPARPGELRALPARGPRPLGIALGAAALLGALALAVFLLLRVPEPHNALPPPPYLPSNLRAGVSTLERDLARAMRPYMEAEFNAAESRLAAFLVEYPEHPTARFYRAAALEALQRSQEARLLYAGLARQAQGMLREHAAWRLASLELLAGERASALLLLRELAATGQVFAPNAEALLAELGE